MLKSASTRAALLPYPVIAAAVRGEPDAVNAIVLYYSGYIAALSTRTSYDVHGCPHSYVDEELRRRLETKLIIAILDFDLN
ncbi:helix-turn-helix domain-containing protein [Intestinibacillus massiliensis]|nr:helix-turn-helix domain-containing protein [Intestinibacillus massiliensis]MCC2865015.1 helix-turn-helix domain-containing protein [Anaerovorax odorimutans]